MNIDRKQLIKDLIHQAENLPLRDDNELDALKRRAEMIIRKIFSEKSKYLDDLKAISFYPMVAPVDYLYKIKSWKSGQQSFINLCKTILEDITYSEIKEELFMRPFSQRSKHPQEIMSREQYITIKELPDDFYYDLIGYINRVYSGNIFPAVRILNRKLLENLIVDLLRKRFGMREIDLFYDKKNGRFHGFNVLLKNMNDKIGDFKPISAAIDRNFLKSINKFRISGNSSAHTIELQVTKEEIDKEKEDLIFIVKVLSKAIKSL